MPTRTLQRHLNSAVDFEEYRSRRSEAIRLLCEGVHSISDIAFKAGYSDAAHTIISQCSRFVRSMSHNVSGTRRDMQVAEGRNLPGELRHWSALSSQ